MTVLLILTGALLTITSCWAAGRIIFRVGRPRRRLSTEQSSSERARQS